MLLRHVLNLRFRWFWPRRQRLAAAAYDPYTAQALNQAEEERRREQVRYWW